MRVAVLGTGNMGKALIGGLQKAYGKDVSILAHDQYKTALSGLELIAKILPPDQWFKDTTPDAIIISVKPADVPAALGLFKGIPEDLLKKVLWISIAAGISIETLQKMFPRGARICRVMPNTPALIGAGISAFSLNSSCEPGDTAKAEFILKACGKTISVPEKMMNAVTGLSGSGPAYVFLFIESLIEGGITAGLSYSVAYECALQTVIGAAEMVEKTKENTWTLKTRVMSPAGTTASGLTALEKHGFKNAVIQAVVDASKRSEQLGA